jgi:acetate kinase
VRTPQRPLLSAQVRRIGSADCVLSYTIEVEQPTSISHTTPIPPIEGAVYPAAREADTLAGAAAFLTRWLEEHIAFNAVAAIGHRVVHGLDHTHAALIDEALLQQLRDSLAYDPDHVPGELALIEQFRKTHPQIPQVASFDTAFHHTLPDLARRLPLPRRFHEQGIRRYGFHGLAYTSVLEKLMCYAPPDDARGRCILAHLGSGASITAVRSLQSIDTSMGFTPAGGLVMGTRSGDLDPGLVPYLQQQEQLSPQAFNDLVNHQSGLLGISGTSSDMEDLLTKEGAEHRAAQAIALFCYQVKKYIGSYAAVLGGLDLLAFSGGIGENAAPIRSRICAGLEFLGIELDEVRNERNSQHISTDSSRVPVYVVSADEEHIIARNTAKIFTNLNTA